MKRQVQAQYPLKVLCSNWASAKTLQNRVEMGINHIDSLAFERKEDRRKQERTVQHVREDQEDDDDNDFRALMAGLFTKKQLPCAKAYVGYCQLLMQP